MMPACRSIILPCNYFVRRLVNVSLLKGCSKRRRSNRDELSCPDVKYPEMQPQQQQPSNNEYLSMCNSICHCEALAEVQQQEMYLLTSDEGIDGEYVGNVGAQSPPHEYAVPNGDE